MDLKFDFKKEEETKKLNEKLQELKSSLRDIELDLI